MKANEIIHADGHVGPIETLAQAQRALFNAAYRGLRWQGWAPAVDGSWSATRAPQADGTTHCCALGWAVPDNKLGHLSSGTPALAAPSPHHLADPLSNWYARATFAECVKFVEFMRDLQEVHDGTNHDESVKPRMERFRREYGFPVPK